MDAENAAAPSTTSTSGFAMPAGAKCAREKYWHEKTAEEKCLKLGEAVEYLTCEIKELRQQANDFKVHMHGASGILIPLPDGTQVDHESYFFRNPLGRENKF